MSGRKCRPESRPACRAPFPESVPSRLNHLVLTGALLDEPHEANEPARRCGRSASARVPVRDPERPEDLWTLARCEVEVPTAIAERSVPDLRVGAPVLAWGQLSDHEADEDGTQRGVIVAAAVHSARSEAFGMKARLAVRSLLSSACREEPSRPSSTAFASTARTFRIAVPPTRAVHEGARRRRGRRCVMPSPEDDRAVEAEGTIDAADWKEASDAGIAARLGDNVAQQLTVTLSRGRRRRPAQPVWSRIGGELTLHIAVGLSDLMRLCRSPPSEDPGLT